MPIHNYQGFTLPTEHVLYDAGIDLIEKLQAVLVRLRLPVEVGSGLPETRQAVIIFQERVGLSTTGEIDTPTLEALNVELAHLYFRDNKTRMARLQAHLVVLGPKFDYVIDPAELEKRRFGSSTASAIVAYKQANSWDCQNDRMSPHLYDELENSALEARFNTQDGIVELHRKLKQAIVTAKLNIHTDTLAAFDYDVQSKVFGNGTVDVINAFQTQKCGMPQSSGIMDGDTYERLQSVYVSRPVRVRKIAVPASVNLSRLSKKALRINTTGESVSVLQRTLSNLGYEIAQDEFSAKLFGKTTRAAVIQHQKSRGLFPDGHVQGETLEALRGDILERNPRASAARPTHRIRGTVRDEDWKGKLHVRVQVFEKTPNGETLLADRETTRNGFYVVPYSAPLDRLTGQVKNPLDVVVRAFGANGAAIGCKTLLNPARSVWVNFTEGTIPYRGCSAYEGTIRKLTSTTVTQMGALLGEQTLTRLSRETGVEATMLMRLDLAHRVAALANDARLSSESFYLFLAQNLPSGLPEDLLRCTEGWTEIGNLANSVFRGIVLMRPEDQAIAFKRAVKRNLVPIETLRKRKDMFEALEEKQIELSLAIPVKVNGGTLGQILDLAGIPQPQRSPIVEAFLAHDGMNAKFWQDPRVSGLGSGACKQIEAMTHLMAITRHVGLSAYIRSEMPKISDCAKLDRAGWKTLISASGIYPTGVQIADEDATYATLQSESQRTFPSIALAAEVARSASHGLNNLPKAITLLDMYPDLDLEKTNIAVFTQQKRVASELAGVFQTHELRSAVADLAVLQRLQRISPEPLVCRALIEGGFSNAAAVVFAGQTRVVQLLSAKGISVELAAEAFNRASFQYAQVIDLLVQFRSELNFGPAAVIGHTYKPNELPDVWQDNPDLQALFGPEDFRDCHENDSVWGAPAYLADMLRFLGTHDAEDNGTVLDVLFERRPDIKRIKLNRDNTETALPYADLVCEVLEHAVVPPRNFEHQTTWSPPELRACPEHVQTQAYSILRTSDYPMDASFDLWQEEARAWLKHLGVPRYELMALLAQPNTTQPAASISAEYFGISTHEQGIITTAKAIAGEQKGYWGFSEAPTFTTIRVSNFLERSNLSYTELLALEQVRWLSAVSWADRLGITNKWADLSRQDFGPLSVERLDRIHRFLRLWRKTDWKMWELDLLIRSAGMGNGNLDENLMAKLSEFHRVQKMLGLSCEEALPLFDGSVINQEQRTEPENSSKEVPSLYERLFASRGGTLLTSEILTMCLPVLKAAFGVSEQDLALLFSRLPDLMVNGENLRKLYGWAVVARGLSLSIEQLLQLADLAGVSGCSFASPQALLSFIALCERVSASGLKIGELAYVLTYRPEFVPSARESSPYALREEAITLMLEQLREARRTAQEGAEEWDGKLGDTVAGLFDLPPDRMAKILDTLSINTTPLRDILSAPTLLDSDSNDVYLQITRDNFTHQYWAVELLHRVCFLLERQPVVSDEDFVWLLGNCKNFGIMCLTELPDGADPSSADPSSRVELARWLAFTGWRALVKQFPEPEGASWRLAIENTRETDEIGNYRASAEFWTLLLKIMQWPEGEKTALSSLWWVMGLGQCSSVEACWRLVTAMQTTRRLGVTTEVAISWTNRYAVDHEAIASQIRDAAKSKYDANTWLNKASPIQNELREKKRTALSRYLVEDSLRKAHERTITIKDKDGGCPKGPNPVYWRDSYDLIRYFLLDVEMGADQLTSRIKQAISSVQMFVQRCLLNLERPRVQIIPKKSGAMDVPNAWGQWQYMKNYRVWQAARKILLYPENWIEPELRTDKSPFFEELEADLSKDEMTLEYAEQCFQAYLEKVHEVSRLDVVGVYHEVCADENDLRDLLHVVARTKADPSVYYYRCFNKLEDIWSPWEKVDVDINGEHVHPVVYNRKLYLFWLVFLDKPQKNVKQPPAKLSTVPTDSPEAPKQLEIQLAWSRRTNDGWTSKTVSREKLIHPWERPLSSYQIRPRTKNDAGENELWLDLYISSSKEFHDGLFYNPFINGYNWQANRPYTDTDVPWHSSSFVFDGAVVSVKMRGVYGYYHLHNGVIAFPVGKCSLIGTTIYARNWSTPSCLVKYASSLTYVNTAFGEAGRAIEKLESPQPDITLPVGMHYRYNRLACNAGNSKVNMIGCTAIAACPTSARPFEILVSLGGTHLLYQDRLRSFFAPWNADEAGYRFFPFYHPYTKLFLRELGRSGVDGLLQRKIQTHPQTFTPISTFDVGHYHPKSPSDPSAMPECVDFDRKGAYALYNWEAFFHAPLLIACRLMQNQRFEEAMRWFHYIFDPTGVNGDVRTEPQRYWITKPFFEQNSADYRAQRIRELLENLDDEGNLAEIHAWRNDPFNPHRLGQHRPVAYQRAVVMRYIDNLLAWGDQLFRRDTMESINEATTLYLLAYELLGQRPIKIPDCARNALSYEELTLNGDLDILGNQSVPAKVENYVFGPGSFAFKPIATGAFVTESAVSSISAALATDVAMSVTESSPSILPMSNKLIAQAAKLVSGVNKVPKPLLTAEPLPLLNLYFRIPPNDELLGRWDLVEDRLFKIRHSLNIEGVFRQLPLFEPPIDPALLVKARAAGVDIGSVLALNDGGSGQYRFRVVVMKAIEYCAEVRALGDKLLSILEKRDAEELAVLRSSQESQILEATREVRKLQIREAKEAIAGLRKSMQQAEARRDYYTSREFTNAWETAALALSGAAAVIQGVISVQYLLSAGVRMFPSFLVGGNGFGGTPLSAVEYPGGESMSDSIVSGVQSQQAVISTLDRAAGLSSTVGSYKRRKDDWDHQGKLAEIDIATIERQIAAAELRKAIAERELSNLEIQIDNAKTVEEYYKSKYTNKQLYDWMLQQVSTVYFGAYKLAYDMAMRAQKCMQYELGDSKLSFIQFGYWDSLKKGLLAGEKLGYDLRRMDAAYLELNKREFELTKHISMAEVMPAKLLDLKTTGTCTFELPEWLFDMDYRDHYRRRIKSVSLTIPCVHGPYSGVHATLTLTKENVRTQGGLEPVGPPRTPAASTTSIATSEAQDDAGVFELNFNDERYLPFEGAGVISAWTLNMPSTKQFDVDSISDVILTMRYTAVRGGPVRDNAPKECFLLLDLKREYPTVWNHFEEQEPVSGKRVFEFELTKDLLPFYAKNEQVKVGGKELTILGSHGSVVEGSVLSPANNASALNTWQVEIEGEDVQAAYLVIHLTWG